MDIRNKSQGFNVFYCILSMFIFPILISTIFIPTFTFTADTFIGSYSIITYIEMVFNALKGTPDFSSIEVLLILSAVSLIVTYILAIIFSIKILIKAIKLIGNKNINTLYISPYLLKFAKTLLIQIALFISMMFFKVDNIPYLVLSTGGYMLIALISISLLLVLFTYWSNDIFAKGINKVLSTLIILMIIFLALFTLCREIFNFSTDYSTGELSTLISFIFALFNGSYASNWYYSFIVIFGAIHLFIAFIESLKLFTSEMFTNDDDYNNDELTLKNNIIKQNYPLTSLEHSIFLVIATIIYIFILPLGYKYMFNAVYKINIIDYVIIGITLLILIFNIINLATSPKIKIIEKTDNSDIKTNNTNKNINNKSKYRHEASEVIQEPEGY